MKRTIYVASFAVALCALLTVPVSAETTINQLVTYDQPWFIKSEPSVADFSMLRWEPEKPQDDKDPRQEFASGNHQRRIAWRLDEGQVGSIDWRKVQNQLFAKFKINIGAIVDVTIPVVEPVKCYCVCGSGYAAYSREVYEIHQKGNTAVISILRPIDGVAVVYDNCMSLQYPVCNGAPPPMSMQGTCASVTNRPFDGDCGVGSGSKRRFGKDPLFTGDDPEIWSTWGTIKELYRNE